MNWESMTSKELEIVLERYVIKLDRASDSKVEFYQRAIDEITDILFEREDTFIILA